jgi:hypothetical protein
LHKWTDVYRVVEKPIISLDSENEYLVDHPSSMYRYEIIEINSSKIIGSYQDYRYAIKQARYKYKKLIAMIEKILLSQ